MTTPLQRRANLEKSPEYRKAAEAYTNAYHNGAGRQAPNTVGFLLWLLYDGYFKMHKAAPTSQIARRLACDHALNETSAVNALGKWAAFNGLRPPRTGDYSIGPKS